MKKQEQFPRYWLMKSEPAAFGINDLEHLGESPWDGVRNYQVRNMMRDQMRVGDRALFYHSSTKEVGVAGEMEIVSEAFVDPTQFDKKSQYYDDKSTRENPRWLAVMVRHVRTYPKVVALSELRRDPALVKLRILERGNRLSVTEVTQKEYERIVTLAGK